MFEYNVKNKQVIFCNNSFFTINNQQKFVYLKKTNKHNIEETLVLDIGVVFNFNNKKYKIIRIKNWLGVISVEE